MCFVVACWLLLLLQSADDYSKVSSDPLLHPFEPGVFSSKCWWCSFPEEVHKEGAAAAKKATANAAAKAASAAKCAAECGKSAFKTANAVTARSAAEHATHAAAHARRTCDAAHAATAAVTAEAAAKHALEVAAAATAAVAALAAAVADITATEAVGQAAEQVAKVEGDPLLHPYVMSTMLHAQMAQGHGTGRATNFEAACACVGVPSDERVEVS